MSELKDPTTYIPLEISPEWKPPKELLEPITNKTSEIVNTIFTPQGDLKKDAPDTILVLQRSASLPFETAREKISKNPNSTNIKIVELPIGKVIPLTYTSYIEDKTGEEVETTFELNEHTREEFIHWLKETKDPAITSLLESVREYLSNSSKLYIVDDAKSSGETLEETVKAVLQASLDKEFDIRTITYFSSNYSWERSIIESLDMDISPLEKSVFKNLLIGSIDLRYAKEHVDFFEYAIPEERRRYIYDLIDNSIKKGNVLLPINSQDSFELAGYVAFMEIDSTVGPYTNTQDYHEDYSNNPGTRILNKYGIENLIKWRSTVIDRIKKNCEATAG